MKPCFYNLFQRPIRLDVRVALPDDMQGASYALSVHRLSRFPGAVDQGLPSSNPPPVRELRTRQELDPEAIYAVTFERSGLD